MSLITIYGPNDDTPTFYEGLTDIIRELQNQDIIFSWRFQSSSGPRKRLFQLPTYQQSQGKK